MVNFAIREMEPDDRPAVLDIIALTMTEEDLDWAQSTLDYYFQGGMPSLPYPIPRYYVAVSDGKVVGVSGYYIYRRHYWLSWFAVHPGYQKRGIGSALLGQVEEELSRLGVGELYVLTSYLPQFDRAREFYRRKGFVNQHRVNKRRYGDDALVLSKRYRPSRRQGRVSA